MISTVVHLERVRKTPAAAGRRARLAASVASLALGASSLCTAQTVSPAKPEAPATPAPANAAPSPTPSNQVAEVIVTAQKRSENVQTVPISMTALSGDHLAEKGVSGLQDLQYAAPSLSVENAGLTQSVNIRGIGLASGSPNAANGVASYLDGVFQPPIVSGGRYYDIADIEVLRGPQGTFVGSNSTGGAIFINSQSPKLSRFEGYGQLGGGSYGAIDFEGAVNIPLGDTLAFRAAVEEHHRDSFFVDHGPLNNKPDSLDELGSRFGLTWRPIQQYQATFKLETLQRETGGYAYQPVPGTHYAAGYSEPSIRDLDYNSPTANNERSVQGTLEQHVTTDNGYTFKSITGYQNKQIHNLYDTDATATASNTENQFVREKVYTQEFDILSPSGGRFSWITGGYFQRNRIDVIIHNGAFPTDILVQNKKTTLGGFGQVSYDLTDSLKATVGTRYSSYEVFGSGRVRIGAGIPGFPPSGLVVADTGGHEKDHAVTGKANIDWTFAPNNLLYAFVARGYKAGGYTTETFNFKKETVWNYEAGWKSSFLDNAIKTQADVFYNNYSNFQFDTVNTSTGQGTIQNIPTAKIYGVEAQAQARLGAVHADVAAAYIHSRLGTYTVIDQNLLPPGTLLPQCAPGVVVGCTDYTNASKTISGAANLLSPDFTFNAGVEYAIRANDTVTITPRLNYAYQSSQDAQPARDPFYTIKGRGLLSALITVDYKTWALQFRASNLLDKQYITGFSVSGSAGSQFYGSPRQFDVVLRHDF